MIEYRVLQFTQILRTLKLELLKLLVHLFSSSSLAVLFKITVLHN